MAVVRKKVKEIKERKPTLRDKVETYAKIRTKIEQLQKQLDGIRQDLIEELGTNFTGRIDNYKIAIKELTTHRIDSTKLKERYPEIAAEVEKEVKVTRVTISNQ